MPHPMRDEDFAEVTPNVMSNKARGRMRSDMKQNKGMKMMPREKKKAFDQAPVIHIKSSPIKRFK